MAKIPFRLTQAQFRERYARSLDKLSHGAIATLRQHFSLPLSPGIDSAEVKIFVGDEDPYVPAVWIYYVGKDNKVDNADQSLFAGRSLELPLALDTLDEFNERFFTDEKFGGLDLVASVLQSWVAECWWKAGGWAYPLPVLIAVDGYGDGKPAKLTERTG